jgi:hypothetical protein
MGEREGGKRIRLYRQSREGGRTVGLGRWAAVRLVTIYRSDLLGNLFFFRIGRIYRMGMIPASCLGALHVCRLDPGGVCGVCLACIEPRLAKCVRGRPD